MVGAPRAASEGVDFAQGTETAPLPQAPVGSPHLPGLFGFARWQNDEPQAPGPPASAGPAAEGRPPIRPGLIALGLVALTACATGAPPALHLGPGPLYRLGPVDVWILPPAQVAEACRAAGLVLPPDQRPRGCYLPRNLDGRPEIIAPPDAFILLHEFRHHLEPAWRHP